MNRGFFPTIFIFSLFNVFFFTASSLLGQSLQLREGWWHTNDEVTSMAYNADDNVVYLGGKFTHIGPAIPFGAQTDTLGQVSFDWAKPNGKVKTAVGDGVGGWYVGGDFTQVGGQPRLHLAHLDVNGNVTAWNPGANGTVNSIVLLQSVLYVGGDFTVVGGQPRSRLADIDPVTGITGTWDPNVNGPVNSISYNDAVLVVGGAFSIVTGQTRNNIASFDYMNTGVPLTTWNPNANGQVWTVLALTSTIYAGGDFTNIGGAARNRIAALNQVTGAATTWNPNANGSVFALMYGNATGDLIVGGAFTTIGGQPRNRVGSLSLVSGTALPWNPNANGPVRALSQFGQQVIIGGDFTLIGGLANKYLAAFHAVTAAPSAWQVAAGAPVEFVSERQGDNFYNGGDFHSLGGYHCSFLAAIDANTGAATTWLPAAGSFVSTLTYANGIVYAGGFFTTLNGSSRNYIGALNAADGNVTPWNPVANNTVTALLHDAGLVYVGGNFTDIGGQARNFVAALDENTGLATTWNPNANNTVNTFALSGTTLYTGGSFTNIGGQNRNFIAALNTATGNATSWNPSANFSVTALAVSGTTVYAAGAFSSIGSQPRNYLAALSTASGFATLWNPGPDQPLYTLAQSTDLVFVGGDFTNFASSLPRNKAAALEKTTGFTNNWDPNLNNRASSMLVLPDGVIVGGLFSSVLGDFAGARHGLAAFEWGCVDADIPTLSADVNNVCPGTSVQLSVSSGSVNDASYWQWYTEACGGTPAGVGIFNTVSPTETTTYYARAEGGCPIPGACAEITIAVIPNSFSVVDTIVCVNYTAPDGAVYTQTGNYLATLTNQAGCDSLITINLIVDPAQTTGNLAVLTTAGGNPFSNMKVELFISTPGISNAFPQAVAFSDATGNVLFEEMPAGQYFCRAVPNPTLPGQQNMMLTYSNEVYNWSAVELIQLQCYETDNEEIGIIQLEAFSGPGTANGHVFYRSDQSPGGMATEGSFSVRSFFEGDPIPGIPVILNKDSTNSVVGPSGDYFAFAMTLTEDNTGDEGLYTFSNLPEGFYRVDVEMPGIPHAPDNYHYFQVLIPEVSFGGLDFFVDTTVFIYITDDIDEIIAGRNGLKVYPNPFNNHLTLQSADEPLHSFQFMLSAMDGRLVKTGSRIEQDFISVFSFADLPRGVYFLRIFRNEKTTTIKVVKD